jgi:hypothetical protein
MNSTEIKKMLIDSLSVNNTEAQGKFEEETISYDFSAGFEERVLDRVFDVEKPELNEIEFAKYLKIAFYRIALSGIAAIVLLLISLFLMEGSLSFNSILGLSDSNNESIVCLLTGN